MRCATSSARSVTGLHRSSAGGSPSRRPPENRSTGVALPPFQRFLDEHADAMWRLCAASVGRVDADDAFQEACLAALRAYPRLRANSNLRSWALTIAHRKALDHHRARARRPVAVGVPEPDGAAPRAPEPDDGLWDAVRALPAAQRAALTMR